MLRNIMLILFAFFSVTAFAQTIDDLGVFQQALELIKNWGGMAWAGQVAGGVFLLIGLMKVSFLSKFWEFLGEYKPLAVGVLSLVAGIVSLAIDPGTDITMAGVLAYVTVGSGAMILNSILDMVKAIPGVGSVVVSVIDFLQIILRSQSALESKNLAAKKEVKAKLAV